MNSNFILKNKNFALVWLGQVLSQAGSKMYQIAIMWWMLDHLPKDQQGVGISIFMVLSAIPAILFVKKIGSIIDKTPSKTVMIYAEMAAGAVISAMALLMYLDRLEVYMVYISGFFVALCQAFIDPTLPKSVPELVPEKDVETAISFETSTQSLAFFMGAVFGALCIDRFGMVGAVVINALSYLLSSFFLLFVTFTPQVTENQTEEQSADNEGWKILNRMPFIKKVLMCFASANFFATPIFIILPLYVKNLLKADASVLATLEASVWVGLIIGAFSSKLLNRFKEVQIIGGVCIVIFGAMLTIPGLLINQYFYMLSLFIAGICLGLNNVKFITLFQERVDPALKGRFFSIMQAMISFSFPISYLLFGFMIDLMPLQILCLIQGVGVLLTGFFLMMLKDN